jgi:DNA-directed RNA polymerase specialized sigma24 family protein
LTRASTNELALSLVKIQRIALHQGTLDVAMREEVSRARAAGGSYDDISHAAGVSRETIRRMCSREQEHTTA